MKNKIIISSIFAIAPLIPNFALAQTTPSFASIFTDNMVIQHSKPIKLWGKGEVNNNIAISFGNQNYTARTDNNGNWQIELPPQAISAENHTISLISNNKSAKIENILIGDVFLCSGQSNMEFTTKYETNAEQNINQGADPLLRFYNVPKQTADYEQSEFSIPSNWQIAQKNTIGDTSALCFSMAQEFRKKQKIPIGFINSSWGGTKIETWISEGKLNERARYRPQLEHSNAIKRDPKGAFAAWASENLKYWDAKEPNIAAKMQWRNPDFNDTNWRNINVGEFWESAEITELSQFDGVVWYRTKFTLSADQTKSDANIFLGPIDDSDNLFINGKFIGATDGWDKKREYKIPAGILKTGENTIAIRIYDGGGGGGLWGDVSDNYITFGNGQNVTLPASWKYKISASVNEVEIPPSSSTSPASRPSTIYNAMIAPLRGLSFRSVAWYQGESNVGLAGEYIDATKLWMENWRKDFNDPNLPFGIVQLSAFGKSQTTPTNSAWAQLRDAQLKAILNDKNSAIATSLDIGDKYDIHPTQKQVLGLRLAKALGAIIYQNGFSRTGPIPVSARKNGRQIRVEFANLNGALLSYSAKYPPGIEVCDNSRCEFALAQVQNNGLNIQSPNNMNPTKIRYAYSESPIVSLYSKDDLPIPTFEMEIR